MNVKVVTIKLFGIIALFLIVLIGAILFLQTRYFGSYYVAQKKSDFKASSDDIAKGFDGLQETNDELVAMLRGLKDKQGMIALLYVPSDDLLQAFKKEEPKDAAMIADKESVPPEVVEIIQKLTVMAKSDPNMFGSPQNTNGNGLQYLVSIYPVSVNGTNYTLGIATSIQPVDEAVSALNSVSWLVYAFAIACSLALAILISLLVARPLIREIEKEKALDRMRKEFIANASHEMKTPISIISGYIESMRDGLLTPGERQEYELAIQDEANKMGKLVRDMLEMALLQNVQYEPRKAEVDVHALTGSMLRRFDGQIKEKCIVVEVSGQKPLTVLADESMLEIVLANFLSNAISHTPGQGTIRIRLGQGQEAFRFGMENDGAPIPEESLPHIWEAFYRVDKSHNREAGRFGLGLSIVKMIIDKHGGTVGAQNMEHGVKFYFALPEYPVGEVTRTGGGSRSCKRLG